MPTVTIPVPVLRNNWRSRLGQFLCSPALAMNGIGLGVAIASQYIPADMQRHGLHVRTAVWTAGMGIILVSSIQMLRSA